ncbi:MAG: ribose 5-phosphate isomerase B [Pseudomonadota bacterium]
MRIIIGCDHGGFELKEFIKQFLSHDIKVDFYDAGTFSNESVDYPYFGSVVAEKVQNGEFERGILICGTGIGMSIVANRFPKIRAALCHDTYTARMSREHNDSNILVIGGRVTDKELAREMLRVWLTSEFQGGRHQRRLEKIADIEKTVCCSQSTTAQER